MVTTSSCWVRSSQGQARSWRAGGGVKSVTLCCGVQVNEKCDIYALGIMLWECLTGTRPFAGMMPVQVMHQMIARQRKGQDWLPFPRQCPDQVASLIRRCWRAENMQRISSEEVCRSPLGM
jgi:serine/threonine protein kinase